jgi:hypothetical protein
VGEIQVLGCGQETGLGETMVNYTEKKANNHNQGGNHNKDKRMPLDKE